MSAATKGTAKLPFGPTMLALRGITQNYVIEKDFATPFQDGCHSMTRTSGLWTVAISHLNGVQMRDQHNQNLLSCITDEEKMDRWFGNGQTMMTST